MKAFLSSFLLLTMTIVSAYGQLGGKVGRTPAITKDWQNGYINITEFSGALGLASTDVPYSKSYFGVTTVNGYQFSRYVKAGIGVGLQFHNGGMLIPAFMDGRLSLPGQKIVPFLGIAGGVALSPDDFNAQSRVFVNPSVGVRFITIPKLGITLSLGLMTQAGGSADYRSSFINFKLGAEFKGPRWF